MKEFTKCVCLVLILSLLCVVPVCAEEAVPYASAVFSATETYLYTISGNQIGVRFEVIAKTEMDELGVRSIVMQRSSDDKNWKDMKTLVPEDYPQMIDEGAAYYANGVPYNGTSGYCYRAYVEFYAKNGNRTGVYFTYTESMKL